MGFIIEEYIATPCNIPKEQITPIDIDSLPNPSRKLMIEPDILIDPSSGKEYTLSTTFGKENNNG
jgi:hypothetical protein